VTPFIRFRSQPSGNIGGQHDTHRLSFHDAKLEVPCKRRSSVNSGAWLRRFDDVTGVEKSCVVKEIKGKKQKRNILLLQINMRFSQTFNAWMFAIFKNAIHAQLLKPIFCPEPL